MTQLTAVTGDPDLAGRCRARAAERQPDLAALRRAVHADPEVGLELPRTQARVLAALNGLGLELHRGRSCGSVVAVVRGARPGPVTLLRADMDALPVAERTGLPYAATGEAMHACGHDLHTAMLVGAAGVLAGLRDELAGSAVLAWQPGEEGYDGMALMMDDGLLDAAGEPPSASYALHVLGGGLLPPGVFGGRAGASHASTAQFTVTVRGVGGHAAFPHDARDPVPAAAEFVLALQAAVTRRFDVFDPVVVTVSTVHAGTAANVIAPEVVLSGTARSFSPHSAMRLRDVVTEVAAGVAAAHGIEAAVDYVDGYPPVINDETEVARAQTWVSELLGPARYRRMTDPIPAGDDYSRVLERVPGAFLMLGADPADTPRPAPNHSPEVVFDDALLADGAAVLAYLALRRGSIGEDPVT